jgi:dTMP kinase
MHAANKIQRDRRGLFITFEGPEGAGKTTHIRKLREHLTKLGLASIATREPGGTDVAEKLREIVKHPTDGETIADETELLLFAASRAQHVRHLILPSLTAGITVLCDRFADSTTAYQGYARGQDMDFVRRLNHYAVCGCDPDLTILLDLPVSVGFERTQARQSLLFDSREDRIEAESWAFHERVRDGFLKIAENEPKRVRIIDANQPEETVQTLIRRLADDAFSQI